MNNIYTWASRPCIFLVPSLKVQNFKPQTWKLTLVKILDPGIFGIL